MLPKIGHCRGDKQKSQKTYRVAGYKGYAFAFFHYCEKCEKCGNPFYVWEAVTADNKLVPQIKDDYFMPQRRDFSKIRALINAEGELVQGNLREFKDTRGRMWTGEGTEEMRKAPDNPRQWAYIKRVFRIKG